MKATKLSSVFGEVFKNLNIHNLHNKFAIVLHFLGGNVANTLEFEINKKRKRE